MEGARKTSLWTLRLMGVVVAVQLVAIAAVVMAITSLFPLKTVRPFAVNFANKSDVVATIMPISKDVGGFDELAQSLAREYVVMRHTVLTSRKEMDHRWGPEGGIIAMESSPEVYHGFLKEAIAVSHAILDTQSGATVTVDVKSVSTLVKAQQYQVEWLMETRDKAGRMLLQKSFISTLDVEFDAISTDTSFKLVNPTGFTVIGYRNVEKTS